MSFVSLFSSFLPVAYADAPSEKEDAANKDSDEESKDDSESENQDEDGKDDGEEQEEEEEDPTDVCTLFCDLILWLADDFRHNSPLSKFAKSARNRNSVVL